MVQKSTIVAKQNHLGGGLQKKPKVIQAVISGSFDQKVHQHACDACLRVGWKVTALARAPTPAAGWPPAPGPPAATPAVGPPPCPAPARNSPAAR